MAAHGPHGKAGISSSRRFFGTDGIRGTVGVHPVTPDFVMKLGWAAGRVLAAGGKGPVLVGKDTRISGYMFESALEAGLSAAGIDIVLLGPLPTPAIAFLARNTRAQAGIVISASHNPYPDNGFKFFSGQGTKLPDDDELAIEAMLDEPLQTVPPGSLGKARRMVDAPRRYIEFCKSRVEPVPDLSGLRLVVDCAHGASYHVAPRVFEELGASVDAIGVQPDGMNINAGCGATDTGALCARVRETGADLGIALDGDGDRVILVDNRGEAIDGDDILFILTSSSRAHIGGVVGTLMSNLGLELAVRGMGLRFVRARVGDRYVMETLLGEDLRLGGESSGHIINLDLATTGDGIIAALQVLDVMRREGRSLRELLAGLEKFPQRLVNLPMQAPLAPAHEEQIRVMVSDFEQRLGGRGRILVRPSGTEPLLRVMVEGSDPGRVESAVQGVTERLQTLLHGSA